jgi:large subunit ribosomal protein L24
MKIKKGDSVVILAGKDKGKTGTVLHAYPKKDTVLVEGINIATRHQKSRRRGSQGQIVHKPLPIHASNVAPKGEKNIPARVGYLIEGEGKDRKKVRVNRKNGSKI